MLEHFSEFMQRVLEEEQGKNLLGTKEHQQLLDTLEKLETSIARTLPEHARKLTTLLQETYDTLMSAHERAAFAIGFATAHRVQQLVSGKELVFPPWGETEERFCERVQKEMEAILAGS